MYNNFHSPNPSSRRTNTNLKLRTTPLCPIKIKILHKANSKLSDSTKKTHQSKILKNLEKIKPRKIIARDRTITMGYYHHIQGTITS